MKTLAGCGKDRVCCGRCGETHGGFAKSEGKSGRVGTTVSKLILYLTKCSSRAGPEVFAILQPVGPPFQSEALI